MTGAGVQALVSRLLVTQVSGAVPVQAALLMHEQWCLWSSLERDDTAALVRLASLTLLPAAHAAEQPSLGSRITSTLRSVNQSVKSALSSNLGLIRCLTLIVRVSTQHHIQTSTGKLRGIHKIMCTIVRSLPLQRQPVANGLQDK